MSGTEDRGISAPENSAEEVRSTDRDLRKTRVRLEQARQDRNDKLDRSASGHRAWRQSFTGTYGAESLPEDRASDSEIQERWIHEAERRGEEMRSGRVRGEPTDVVLTRIRAKLG